MKKEMLTCDLCGTIIQGPGANKADKYCKVKAVIAHGVEMEEVHSIDVCEDDAPWDIFDGGTIALLFGGSTVYEGEMVDPSDKHVVAVVDEHIARMMTTVYSVDDLDREQRKFVEKAETAIKQAWQRKLDNNPRGGRNP